MKRLYIVVGLWLFFISFLLPSEKVLGNLVQHDTTTPIAQYPEEDEDTYSQIPATELPEAVREAIKLAYPEHAMEAAYKKIDGNFRVTLKKEGERRFMVYYTPGGAFIRSTI